MYEVGFRAIYIHIYIYIMNVCCIYLISKMILTSVSVSVSVNDVYLNNTNYELLDLDIK